MGHLLSRLRTPVADSWVVVQFGFLVARSTCCPGLPWMTKVPRRGTTLLVRQPTDETHGLQQNCTSTPKGSNPFYTNSAPKQIQPLRGW